MHTNLPNSRYSVKSRSGCQRRNKLQVQQKTCCVKKLFSIVANEDEKLGSVRSITQEGVKAERSFVVKWEID